MNAVARCDLEERILVFAPIGKDTRLIVEALERANVLATPCRSASDLCREIRVGAGAVFLTEEALDDPTSVQALLAVVDRQPAWSDLPLIVCYGKANHSTKTFFHTLALLDKRGYLSLLERPMSPRLLINAVRSALRARHRQYERRRDNEERQRLVDELGAAKERAEAASRELRDVLEREKEARQAAEDANRSKDLFLATLSHELRTPLNAILGFSELLPYEVPGTPEFESALATIVRNANAQRDLIDDILDVSRIISGKLSLEKTSINLVRLVNETLESFQIAIRRKRQTLRVSSDVMSAVIEGDANRLQQVVSNLLSNAVKFTPEEGLLNVAMARRGDAFEIIIADSGEGIEEGFLPHVFDRFRQQDGSFTRRFGGLGLGLSIVRHLVEAHGGTIEVKSEGKGQGALFKVSLPLAVESQATAASRFEATMPAAFAANEQMPRGRVLIVDDQADSRTLLKVVLRRAGMEVVEAESAAAARQALCQTNVDAIVCDIGMPGEDGLSFIQQLRASSFPHQIHLPAAALSGFASEEDKQRAIRAGFDLHLSKPASPREVLLAMTKLLGLRHAPAQ